MTVNLPVGTRATHFENLISETESIKLSKA